MPKKRKRMNKRGQVVDVVPVSGEQQVEREVSSQVRPAPAMNASQRVQQESPKLLRAAMAIGGLSLVLALVGSVGLSIDVDLSMLNIVGAFVGIAALILTIAAWMKREKSVSMLLGSLSLVAFNATFRFDAPIIWFVASVVLAGAALIFSIIDVKKIMLKREHIVLCWLWGVLLLSQVIIGVLLLLGVLG